MSSKFAKPSILGLSRRDVSKSSGVLIANSGRHIRDSLSRSFGNIILTNTTPTEKK